MSHKEILASIELADAKIKGIQNNNFMAPVATIKFNKAKAALASIHEGLKKNQKPMARELVAAADYCHNVISSFQDALSCGDVDETNLSEFKREVSAKLTEVREFSEQLVGVMAAAEKETASKLDDALTDGASILSRYASFKNKMPRTALNGKKFVLLDMPVIPVFDPFILPSQLAEAGFNVESLGTYAILNNQRVLGINTNYLKEEGIKLDEYTDMVLEALKSKTGKRWIRVFEDPVGFRSSGYQFFWIGTEHEVKQLTTIKGRHTSIDEWGWAFSK